MASCLKNMLIQFVIWIQEIYICFIRLIKSCAYSTLIYYSMYARWAAGDRMRIVAAFLHDQTDVTIETRLFYKFDNIRSCASLQRWLIGFGYNRVSSIKILFINIAGDLNISYIDLDGDHEHTRDAEIPDGDVSLVNLPASSIDISHSVVLTAARQGNLFLHPGT